MADELIEKIMQIEDPFIEVSENSKHGRGGPVQRNDQGRAMRYFSSNPGWHGYAEKEEVKYPFRKGHIDRSTAIIEQVMEMGLSIEDIKQEIESRGKEENEFWRTHEILDDMKKKEQARLEEVEKRLAFMKSTQSRLGKDSPVKLREDTLIEDILSNVKDNPKSGARRKKKKKKKKKKYSEKVKRYSKKINGSAWNVPEFLKGAEEILNGAPDPSQFKNRVEYMKAYNSWKRKNTKRKKKSKRKSKPSKRKSKPSKRKSKQNI